MCVEFPKGVISWIVVARLEWNNVENLWIIFWGNSFNSGKIFSLQKKIVRIMVRAQPRTSCRRLFKQLEILPVPCQYIGLLSLMNFTVSNEERFPTNSPVQAISTIFIDQMPTCLVSDKARFVLSSKCLTAYHVVWQSIRMKRQNLR
jgi:hypothetical protein